MIRHLKILEALEIQLRQIGIMIILKRQVKIVPSFMIYRPHQSPSYSFQYTNKITKENIRIIKNISDLYERINEYRLK